MTSLQKAKEVIRKQLNKGELTPNAISLIEGQMEEIKNLDWKKDTVLLGLHKRYLVQLEQIENNKSGDFQTTIEVAKRRHEALRGSANIISPEQKLMLQKAFRNNPKLKSQMGKLGVKFKKGEVIIPVGFEKTPEYKQMQLFLKASYMTSNPDYTDPSKLTDKKRREKIQLFFDVTRENADFMPFLKRYFGYKLIHSIYQDLKREESRGGPFLVTRDGVKGEYDIVCFPIKRDDDFNIISKKAPDSHPYNEIFKSGKVDSTYIDFASTYSLIEGNIETFVGKKFMGQATLVKKIIDFHGITGVSSEDLQDPNLLIADWPKVVKDIERKMEALTKGETRNIRKYEELAYLKALIEGKEYLSKQSNQEIFTAINTFGKGFLKEQALIADSTSLRTGGAGKESIGEALTSSVNSVALPIVALGVFSMIFGGSGTKKFGFLAIAGLLGANVAGGLIDKVGDFTGNPRTGENPGDTLELIRLRQLQYSIKGGDAINGVLSTLYTENDARLKNTTTTASRDLFIQQPEKIGKILFEISQDDDISKLDTSDVDLADKIYTALQTKGNLAINGTEFTSRLSKKPTVTRDDVNAFVEILKSQADGNDSTLGDLLIANDVDRLNHEYSSDWYSFTESGKVNTELDTVFRDTWLSADRKGRKVLTEVLEKTDGLLYSGAIDGSHDEWEKASTTSSGLAAATGVIGGVGVDIKLTRIDDLKKYISHHPKLAPISVKNLLQGVLTKYEVLLKQEAGFAKIQSGFVDNEGNRLKTTDYLTRASEELGLSSTGATVTEMVQIDDDITEKKNNLQAIKTVIGADPIYSELVDKIDKEIRYIDTIQVEVRQKIDELSGVVASPSGSATETINTRVGTLHILRATSDIKGKIETLKGLAFGGSFVDIGTNIASFMSEVNAGTRNGINATTTSGQLLWNDMKSYLVETLSGISVPGIDLTDVINGMTISDIPPVDKITPRNIEDIEAQIKLAVIQSFLEQVKEHMEKYTKYVTAYKTPIDTKIGMVLPPQNLRELKQLQLRLGTEFDDLKASLETKIQDYAKSYKGAEMKRNINSLTTATNSTNLDNFVTVQSFLDNFAAVDSQILQIRTLADPIFGIAMLDNILVPLSELNTDFAGKKSALKASIVADPGLMTIPTVTTVVKINQNIALLEKANTIINSGAVTLKIQEWKEKLRDVATIADVPGLSDALNTDVAALRTLRSSLQTASTPSIDASGNALDEKGAHVVEILKIIERYQGSANTIKLFKNLEDEIKIGSYRYNATTYSPWDQVQSGSFQGISLKTIESINS